MRWVNTILWRFAIPWHHTAPRHFSCTLIPSPRISRGQTSLWNRGVVYNLSINIPRCSKIHSVQGCMHIVSTVSVTAKLIFMLPLKILKERNAWKAINLQVKYVLLDNLSAFHLQSRDTHQRIPLTPRVPSTIALHTGNNLCGISSLKD